MSRLTVEPLNASFGARITGLDLTSDLSDEDVEAVREAIDTWSFLCFPDQPMNDEAHLAFTRSLGEPEAEHVTLGKTGKVVFFGTVGNHRRGRQQAGQHAPPHPLPEGEPVVALRFLVPPRALVRLHHPRVRGAGRGRRNAVREHAQCVREAAGGHAGHDRPAPRHPRLRLLPHPGRAGGPQPRRLPSSHREQARAHEPGQRPEELLHRLARPLHRRLVGDREPPTPRRPAGAGRPCPGTPTPTSGGPATR